ETTQTTQPTTVVTTNSTTSLHTTNTTPNITQSVFFSFSSNETFVADLENPTSVEYKNRETKVLAKLEPLFKNQFPSFISLLVIKFRRGSIITDLNLTFGAKLPNTEDIKSTIWQANATLNITSVTGKSKKQHH
ncbi:hypothetical protein cypCar_00045256, partial [Cyprinus carpio]